MEWMLSKGRLLGNKADLLLRLPIPCRRLINAPHRYWIRQTAPNMARVNETHIDQKNLKDLYFYSSCPTSRHLNLQHHPSKLSGVYLLWLVSYQTSSYHLVS